VDGRRLALVVATSDYQDPELRRLRSPAQDAAELVEVLGKAEIGGFEVTPVLDGTERDARIALESFLTGCRPDDLAVVYLSCHGLLDARGQLWFAASDTIKKLVGGTGIGSGWLRERLENCRATRQVVLLDCCFSGAYLKRGKGPAEVDVQTLHGGGRGHVVLTASRATEYSYEGEPVDGTAQAGSVFTTALVHGLRTGAADLDNDGLVTTDEAYDYVNQYLRTLGANQTPTHNVVGGEGRILLARSPAGIRPTIPAQSTVQVVAEAAEIMAVAPAVAAARPVAPPVDGPAAELATLRVISRVLDDPDALAKVIRERSVDDLVKVMAALRASGFGDRAPEVLGVAATVRSVEEVVEVAEKIRLGAHKADAELLLAAVGSRDVADVVRLCADPAQRDSNVRHVLRWAARIRTVTEVREIAPSLPEKRAVRFLGEYGKARSGADIAQLLVDAPEATIAAVLDGVATRPQQEIAVVVKALRRACEDATADRVLGWVEQMEASDIAALVDGLRTADAGEDAETVLRWAGWRLAPAMVVALVEALSKARDTTSVSVVVKAAESRPGEEVDEMVLAALDAEFFYVRPVLEIATRRSRDEIAKLVESLEPKSPYYLRAEPEQRAADRFAATLTGACEVEDRIELAKLLESDAAVDRLAVAAAHDPVDLVAQFFHGLCRIGRERSAGRLISAIATRPPDEVGDLVETIASRAGSGEIAVLIPALAGFPQDRLNSVLSGLDRAAPYVVDRFIMAVRPIKWYGIEPPGEEDMGADALRLNYLRRRGEVAHKRQRRNVAAIRGFGSSATVVFGALVLVFFASITRVFADTSFDFGDWVAWVGLTLLAAVVLLVALLILYLFMGENGGETWSRMVGVVTVVAAVLGLALPWFVPPLSDAATQLRDWLALKF
jgi:heme/copper-type cytochrome/quinol oxidase subunit 4